VTHIWPAALLICLVGCGPSWSQSDIEESQRRGDAIIAALRAYRAKHGTYPQALQALVPGYLSQLEPPTVGERKWVYVVDRDGQGCGLEFRRGPDVHDPRYMRAAGKNAWDYDDGSF